MGSTRSNPLEARSQAWWLFEERGEWLGFSPAVSDALEAAYQGWAQEPQGGAGVPTPVDEDRLLYAATFSSSLWDAGKERLGQHASQGIRRITIAGAEAEALPTRQALCEEAAALRARAEALEQQEEAGRQRLAALGAELERAREEGAVWRERSGLLDEDLRLGHGALRAERDAAARLLPHLSGIYPGRLVSLAARHRGLDSAADLPVGALGRVRSVEGGDAAVEFADGRPVCWLPTGSLELASDAELLARPGARARWRGEDGCVHYGVVCGPIDRHHVSVLGPDGRERAFSLLDLEAEAAGERLRGRPPEVGDLVWAPGERVKLGMVVRRDGPRLCVRLSDVASVDGGAAPNGCLDLELRASAFARSEAADAVRPGAAVRLGGGPNRDGAVGVVYATHLDGTAVVDFLGSFGCRHNAAFLEVVEPPCTLGHALLRMLSECAAWHEVATELCEKGPAAAA